jgi:hypothetical protein
MKHTILSLALAIGVGYIVISAPIPDRIITTETYEPRFPEYHWSDEENIALATVAANTEGSDYNKQEAIISVLDSILSKNNSIPKVVSIKYINPKEPTEQDFDLVYKTIWGNLIESEEDKG